LAERQAATLNPIQCCTLAAIITSQDEPATNACRRHKRRQKTSGQLNGFAVSTSRNDLVDAASAIPGLFG
jgi:hypothetical protein